MMDDIVNRIESQLNLIQNNLDVTLPDKNDTESCTKIFILLPKENTY